MLELWFREMGWRMNVDLRLFFLQNQISRRVSTRVGVLLIGICAVLLCLSCELPHSVELERIASPDGRVEAVFIRNADYGGATTGYTYSLYIVKKGDAPETDHPSLAVDNIEDFDVEWREEKILEISYKYARIWNFTNWWCSRDINDCRYVVELRLNPRDDKHSLSRRDRWLDTTVFKPYEPVVPVKTLDVWIDSLSSKK